MDKFKQELSREISEVKDEVESQLYSVKEELRELASMICDEQAESGRASFADVVRRKRKKNLLVMLASDQDRNATELKNEVS